LQIAPDDLRPLLGYARLQDRLGRPQEALKLYERAARVHPQEPAVFNHMAVHYTRCGMLREAIGAADRAVQLRPYEPRYRNNMAMLLVEVGRPQEAFFQLHAVYDEAVAHYNLGYLLTKKGQTQAAAQEFAVALRINPALLPAHQWLDRLAASPGPRAEPPGYGPPPPREELRIAAEPRPRIDAPSRGPIEARPAVPEPAAVRLLPPPPQSPRASPPPEPDAGPRRLPPVSNSAAPDSAPPYFPATR
jgi:tetratricopeptide (TPR) repeat protein